MIVSPPHIRIADHRDSDSIAVLAEVCHREILEPLGMRFNIMHTAEFFRENLSRNNDFVAIVAVIGDEVVGCASGSHAESWVSPDQSIFVADSWFLRPDWRRGALGANIMTALIKEARKRCEMMTVTLMSTTTKAAPKVLERLGFVPFEQNFIARII